MSDYIDADALLKALDKGLWGKDWDKALTEAIIKDALAINLVRCKDCKHKEEHDGVCAQWYQMLGDNGYCSSGESKGQEADKKHLITRDDATNILSFLIHSGMFSDTIKEALDDILFCICAEQEGLHIWGIPDDGVDDMYIYSHEKFLADYEKCRFTPSDYEQKQREAKLSEGETE